MYHLDTQSPLLYYFLCSIRNLNLNPLILEIQFSSLYFDSPGNAVSRFSYRSWAPLVGNDDITKFSLVDYSA